MSAVLETEPPVRTNWWLVDQWWLYVSRSNGLIETESSHLMIVWQREVGLRGERAVTNGHHSKTQTRSDRLLVVKHSGRLMAVVPTARAIRNGIFVVTAWQS